MALCSLSIGINAAPAARTSSINRRPVMTSASLFASSTRLPARTAANVGMRPAAPTIAAITVSTPGSATAAASASTPASTRVARPLARNASRAFAAAAGSARITASGRNRRACSTMVSQLRQAPRAATRKRSGCRATTSSVLRPMLPVEPKIATPRTPLMRNGPCRTGRARTGAPPRRCCRCGRRCRRGPAAARRCP